MGKAHEPVAIRNINIIDGEQLIFRFPNNYGASVVCNAYSYGNEEGLWELAVIYWPVPENLGVFDFDLTYDTPITGNVVGHLSFQEVHELLDQIEALPAKE